MTWLQYRSVRKELEAWPLPTGGRADPALNKALLLLLSLRAASLPVVLGDVVHICLHARLARRHVRPSPQALRRFPFVTTLAMHATRSARYFFLLLGMLPALPL